MAYPATFQDIQNAVIAKAKLDDTLDTTRVKQWINEVYFNAVIETEFNSVPTATSSALTANQSLVNIPATIVKIDFIVPTGSDGSVWGPMELVTLETLLGQRAYNAGVTMTTGAPSRYCMSSPSQIQIWPNPNGGETLTFYGTTTPTPLSANSDIPIIPEPYASKVLEYGTLVQAAEFKRDIFIMDFWSQLYADWLTRFRGFVNTRIGDKTQQFDVVGYKPWPRTNSTDSPFTWARG